MAAYTLTLTRGERQAIDWVGHRYAHGDDLYDLLCESDWDVHACCSQEEDWGWLADCPITFNLTEPQAWELLEIAEESEHRWDCFSPELVAKVEQFCGGVV